MPQTAATRELVPTYGSFAISVANGCYVQGDREKYLKRGNYPTGSFSVEFEVILASPTGVTATDNAAFATLCSNAEAALRKPNQRLTVTLGASTLHDINPSSGSRSGYMVRGEVAKVGADEDSSRIRRYRFTCTWKHIADLSGDNNRIPESETMVSAVISGRRTLVATAGWTASTSATAKARYDSDGDTRFDAMTATVANVSGGEWVKVDENPKWDDENAELVVTRTYWEVVSGLREVDVSQERTPSRQRFVTITGMYTKTSSATADANYTANIGTLQSNTMSALGITRFNVVPQRESKRYGVTQEQVFFTRVLKEIIYDQGPSGADDTHVVDYSLVVRASAPIAPRAFTASITPEQLRLYQASYEADIDKDQSTDPKALWDAKYKGHCVAAIQAKLGASQVAIENEDVQADLERNRLIATISGVAKGGDVINFAVTERIVRTGALNPRPRADGTPHSYFLFKQPPRKLLLRSANIEYIAGANKPEPFKSGEDASGYELVDTGQSIFDALDALERGELPNVPGWLALDGEQTATPVTRGADRDFSTVTIVHNESWLYIEKLESAPTQVGS